MKNNYYTAYGLTIESSICLPELISLDSPLQSSPDIQITYGEVPTELDEPEARGVLYQAKPNQFLLHIDNIARYLVLDGQKIVIAPAPECYDNTLRLFLLGSVLAALLHQRGMLVLHGSAIETEAGAVVFVGPSGVGKSTLAATFYQQGFLVLADDVCAVSLDAQGTPLLYPAFPHLKLWADTLEKLEHDTATLQPVRPNLEKYALPLKKPFGHTPLPLHAVYQLTHHNKPDFEFKHLEQMKKFQVLSNNTYRQHFLSGLGMRASHFRHVSAVANHVRVGRVTRPDHPLRLDELVALLIDDFASKREVSHE